MPPNAPEADAPIRIGIMLPTVDPQGGGRDLPSRLTAAARAAEAAGFDAAYVGDHLLHPNPIMDAIVALTAVAACTSRIAIGTCVLLAALREPWFLAKQLATIDLLAPGRLRLGLGVGGEYPAEFAARGVDLARRGKELEAVLETVQSLMAGGYAGSLEAFAPLPDRMPPMFFGGWNEKALDRAARIGDGWIGYLLSPQSFGRRRRILLERAAEQPFFTGMMLPVHLDPSPDAPAWAAALWARRLGQSEPLGEHLFAAGDGERIASVIAEYSAQGCDEIVLAPVEEDGDHAGRIAELARELLLRLR